jgi:hypothetical protein
MKNLTLLDPMSVELDGQEYILSKFKSWDGIEIMMSLPSSLLQFVFPKFVGGKELTEELIGRLFSYVGVVVNDKTMILSTRALVDNHVKDWFTASKLLAKVVEYNCSFLEGGSVSDFLRNSSQALPALVSEVLTAFSEQS